jgi:choline dehydrogenase-like flavoprotein
MTDLTSNQTLRALVERIVPADDYPSGWQAGVGHFLRRIVERGPAGRPALIGAGLDQLDAEARARHDGTPFAALPDPAQDALITDLLAGHSSQRWEGMPADEFLSLMIRLTVQGYYGDPGNGGNRDAVSWDMIGYRPEPDHAHWPQHHRTPAPVIAWPDAGDRYDAVVVGAGAGGGVAACVLAEAGMRVLLVERGRWLNSDDLRPDHLRSHRLALGYGSAAEPPAAWNPRVFAGSAGETVVWPTDGRWHNTAMMVGGGTRLYGAQAWRFSPEDFRMASTYGIPADSSLADWPISYEDLEPDYDRAEWELGVSGDASGNAYAGPRRRGYPMPPLPPNGNAAPLRRGAAIVGISTSPVPLLINSVPYNGRGACIQCGACVGFACPGEFKTDTRNSVIPRAVATGRCDLLTGAQAERVTTDGEGRVVGVALVAEVDGETVRREIAADRVLLGAGAIETARLLLNSPSGREPHGLGNNNDLVGRNLQGHVYTGALAVFDEPVQDCVGPGPSISTNDYRHRNDGIIGGAMLANDFVPMPLFVYEHACMLGLIPSWGAASKEAMRHLYSRLALVMGPVQEIPNPESRVTLDPVVRDHFGMPAARLSGALHPGDRATAAFISERAVAWAEASGAAKVVPLMLAPVDGPSAGQHQAGTCRMGEDPSTSVTDAWGRVWGHDNLHIVDGSLHVTNGGVNPVLTILALAHRVSRAVAQSGGGHRASLFRSR